MRILQRTINLICACLLLTATFATATDARSITYSLDIPSQNLNDALQALALASQHKLLYSSELVDGKTSPALKGEFTTEEAVKRLLSGSNLSYEVTVDGLVLIRAAGAPASSDASSFALPETGKHQEESTSLRDRFRLVQADPKETNSDSAVANPGLRSAEKATHVEEIVVTAQKRTERLKDVPVPVTAVAGEILTSSNQLRLQEYFNRIPNLSVTTGTFHSLQLTIRGLTTGGGNPTVGIVIDDVPYGSTRGTSFGLEAPDIDPSTLQRVEVLRGPQGTLYGASSMGGLLKFVTVPPSTSGFSGRIQGGTSGVRNGSQVGYNLRGSANIPINESLALSASAFTRQDPGYIDNPILGVEGVNEAVFSGGRLAAQWEISPRLSVNVSGLIQQSEMDGTSEVHIRPGLHDLEQDTVRGSGAYEKTVQAYSATISADLGLATLTSLSGYNVSSFDDVVDFSVASGRGAVVIDDYRTEKFSQELRLLVPVFDRIDWLFGAFYTEESSDPASQQIFQADRSTGVLGAETFHSNAPQRFEEYALFTNLTVRFSDSFDVQFGARQGNNEQWYQSVNVLTGSVSPKIESDDDSFTYLVTPRIKLTPDVMVYARLASGYRPGGPNTNVALLGLPNQAYAPDKTKNYELGAKGDLMDGLLSFDASLYRIDWENIQIQILSGGFTFFTNGSKARSQGLELAGELRPYDGLTISAWGARTIAELTEPLPATATVFGADGTRLPYGSKFSGSLSVDQSFALSGEIDGYVGTSVNYVGERLGAFRGVSAGVPLPRQVLPSYTKVDLRAGLRMAEWSADLFLNNLTDRRGILQGGVGQTDPSSFYYIQPRTYGFSISRSF